MRGPASAGAAPPPAGPWLAARFLPVSCPAAGERGTGRKGCAAQKGREPTTPGPVCPPPSRCPPSPRRRGRARAGLWEPNAAGSGRAVWDAGCLALYLAAPEASRPPRHAPGRPGVAARQSRKVRSALRILVFAPVPRDSWRLLWGREMPPDSATSPQPEGAGGRWRPLPTPASAPGDAFKGYWSPHFGVPNLSEPGSALAQMLPSD